MNKDYLTALLFERQLYDDGYDTQSLIERGLIKDPKQVLIEASIVNNGTNGILTLAKNWGIKDPSKPESWVAYFDKITNANQLDAVYKAMAGAIPKNSLPTIQKGYEAAKKYMASEETQNKPENQTSSANNAAVKQNPAENTDTDAEQEAAVHGIISGKKEKQLYAQILTDIQNLLPKVGPNSSIAKDVEAALLKHVKGGKKNGNK